MRKYLAIYFLILGSLLGSVMAFAKAEMRDINMAKMDPLEVEKACRLEVSEFGQLKDGDGIKTSIHPECRKYIESIANPNQRTVSKDGSISIVAGLGIVYIDITYEQDKKTITKNHVIAGDKTFLDNIEYLCLSADNGQLAILKSLNKSIKIYDYSTGVKELDKIPFLLVEKEILMFNPFTNGNVSPSKILREASINKAESITFHPSGKEVYASNSESKSIISFASDSDFRYKGQLADDKTKKSREFKPSEETFRAPASIDFMGSSLLILDSHDKRVISFNPYNNSTEWEMNAEELGIESVSHLQYRKDKKKLILSDSKGKSISLSQD